MRRFAAIFIVLITALSAAAQSATVRHRCWDIVVEREAEGRPYVLVPMMETVDSGARLVTMAMDYLGTPYRYAGRSPKAFDCAGFALYLYRHFGYSLPGWSGAQAHASTGAGVIISRSTEDYYRMRYITARRIFR